MLCQLRRATFVRNVTKCSPNFAFENLCNEQMTSKFIQGNWKWHKSKGHMIILPISRV